MTDSISEKAGDEALKRVLDHSSAGAVLRREFFENNGEGVVAAARTMALRLASGGKILLCGNGGSAADAQHLAAEFVNRFIIERPPLPAIALSTDTSVLTSIGNDYGFDQAFLKQVQALGGPRDVLLALSTSGNSPNVQKACEAARAKGLFVIGILGKDGGGIKEHCDQTLIVEDHRTPLIQEVHVALGHLLCELCDYFLFENVQAIMYNLTNQEHA